MAFHPGERLRYSAGLDSSPEQTKREQRSFDSLSVSAPVRQPVGAQFARSGDGVALLHAGGVAPQPLGPLKQLRVVKGDTVDVVAYGMYQQPTLRPSWGFTLASFVAGLLQPPAPGLPLPDGGRRPRVLPLLSVGLALAPAVPQLAGGVPKAYVRVLVYNADSALVDTKTKQLTSAALNGYETLTLRVLVPVAGYVQAYVANESDTDVFFDDVSVEHRQGLQVQENHYDPFGLDLVGLSRRATPENKSTWNSKERQDEFGLNWHDHGARMYDPAMGRWNVVDPLADHPKQIGISPYVAFNDNPMKYVDPTGMIWENSKDEKRLSGAVNERISNIGRSTAKIQSKIDKGGLSEQKLEKLQNKLADNNQKAGLLNQSLADIKAIGEAKETYSLTSPSQKNGTHGVIKDSNGNIQIEGSNVGLYLHEIRHVGQSMQTGGLKFNKEGQLLNSANNKAAGRINEVNAYQVEYSYDGQYPAGANSLKDINQNSLMNIKLQDGTPVYEKLKE